jgi:hypothetical protein
MHWFNLLINLRLEKRISAWSHETGFNFEMISAGKHLQHHATALGAWICAGSILVDKTASCYMLLLLSLSFSVLRCCQAGFTVFFYCFYTFYGIEYKLLEYIKPNDCASLRHFKSRGTDPMHFQKKSRRKSGSCVNCQWLPTPVLLTFLVNLEVGVAILCKLNISPLL